MIQTSAASPVEGSSWISNAYDFVTFTGNFPINYTVKISRHKNFCYNKFLLELQRSSLKWVYLKFWMSYLNHFLSGQCNKPTSRETLTNLLFAFNKFNLFNNKKVIWVTSIVFKIHMIGYTLNKWCLMFTKKLNSMILFTVR